MIWDSIFDNDAGKIVSKRGLIELMKHDEEAGMYDVDFSEKSKENLDWQELRHIFVITKR